MTHIARFIALLALLASCCLAAASEKCIKAGSDPLPAILVYHRFGATALDSMTVRTSAFKAQLDWLSGNGYQVIPLERLLDAIERSGRLPARAIVITVDDGHRSVLTEMLPLVRRARIPVTLFIYPSAISNASYALRWEELEELKRAGFSIDSHTYWHPNFHREKRKLAPEAYRELLSSQLVKPRQVLAKKLDVKADILAWPFGIFDDELVAAAAAAGYRAALTLERRHPRAGDCLLALPRYLITDSVGLREFAQIAEGRPTGAKP